ncbi:hypothetical protein [Burkholderia plantarii]|uniref:Uncharacterized protein n=1 Tax=Burkholderia plantarii TaxID=41899 RepID=A0A0B6SEJ6_BURPL|nr:hypothetical protein [Burkholderia plantarii]AJK50656.1 hypothetical protein BGL_2c26020 [Burkholderia plantarii]GLZ18733.1 hypothetical protein Bpla01_22630 [Burkholderia plantarii]
MAFIGNDRAAVAIVAGLLEWLRRRPRRPGAVTESGGPLDLPAAFPSLFMIGTPYACLRRRDG